MLPFRFSLDSDRWTWFAEGDGSHLVSSASKSDSSRTDNSVDRVLLEIGAIIAIPLAIAVLFNLVFAQ